LALTRGIQEYLDFSIGSEDMAAFRRVSGDTNPLHYDATFARDRGFDGPVVYGGLIVARISGFLGTRLPGYGCVWRSLSLNFKGPLYVGEHARLSMAVLHENDALGHMELGLTVSAGSRRIADGKCSVSLSRERAHA
jgi:3-hydroxybutyryl-CoA dehydratase